ncbi:EVE domain-containing protein [Rubellicoccus peritrichatus]|uniref:EVE domain-containing protein n=1 Tax=Rubellicoccus peritrichatus TaxID=3080537 RepID=A0AAQ3L5Z9_9BACT|nr:EVE domain-containing protein [Puniceicoccus sp. CR14]WOO39531.1 EVE domain-containing protein [Puniceicoccus sp. CR14]
MKYWLFKSEPDEFSIHDLKARGKKGESWDGVRNYQARNFMRDDMKKGDIALFYHSNCDETGIVGVGEISRESHPDHTAWDPKDKHFDPKTDKDNPRWFMIAMTHKETFPRTVTLAEVKADPKLSEMRIAQRGNRLSITPVTKAEFDHICKLAKKKV